MGNDMTVQFEQYAKSILLDKPQPNQETVKAARCWYTKFTGSHATKFSDFEVVELYELVDSESA